MPWSGNIGGVVVQANGDVVVSGAAGTNNDTLEVTRLNVNGSIDTTFGTKGTWAESFAPDNTYSKPMRGYLAIQSNGELVAAEDGGYLANGDGWFLVRLTTSGVVDTTFGNGNVFTSFGARTVVPTALPTSAPSRFTPARAPTRPITAKSWPSALALARQPASRTGTR